MPRFSIIVPVLDEAPGIAAALAPLQRARAEGIAEVVVVDGGSRDATVAAATPLADRVLAAPRGRASQMNAGARTATGEVFVFLHADTRMPDGALDAIERALAAGATLDRPVQTAGWGRMANLADPFGHGFCLAELGPRGYDALLDDAGA